MNSSWSTRLALPASLAFALVAPGAASAQQQQQKPNILVIMADDIGYWNVSAYIYDWNLLPIGQVLWLKELESYREFPPLQDPASYNLDQVMEQLKKGQGHPSQ